MTVTHNAEKAGPADAALVTWAIGQDPGTAARPGLAVVVAGDRTADIVPESELADDLARLDLSGLTLLPGLIDAHVHLLGQRAMDNRETTFGGGLRDALDRRLHDR